MRENVWCVEVVIALDIWNWLKSREEDTETSVALFCEVVYKYFILYTEFIKFSTDNQACHAIFSF